MQNNRKGLVLALFGFLFGTITGNTYRARH